MTAYNLGSRTMEKTIQGLEILLRLPVYLIIHADKMYMESIQRLRKEYGFEKMTMYVEERFEDIWAAQYIDVVKSNREKYWPSKDDRTCAESHLLCCNKFAFVEDAILRNPFQTSHFGWIDAYSTIKICDDYTSNMIPWVLNEIHDDKFHIQILNVNDRKYF